MNSDYTIKLLSGQRLLPLFYHDDIQTCIDILTCLFDAGIKMVEYTARGKFAFDNFKILKQEISAHLQGMQLGIGTIKIESIAEKYINAGADFIVCPIVKKEIGEIVHKAQLLWIPGCMSATEIALAEDTEAKVVKIFPGSILGPSYISAIKELFPALQFMPTGGVDVEENNLKNWFNSGVIAVGMGSKLITESIINEKDYSLLKNQVNKVMSIISTLDK